MFHSVFLLLLTDFSFHSPHVFHLEKLCYMGSFGLYVIYRYQNVFFQSHSCVQELHSPAWGCPDALCLGAPDSKHPVPVGPKSLTS